MKTRRNRKGWLWMSILIAGLCMAAVSCRAGSEVGAATGTAKTGTVGADTTKIPEIPTAPDTDVTGETPDVPVGDKTVSVSSAELMKLIENGTVAENGDYAVTDGAGLTFSRSHNGKEYDLRGALIRIGVRDGAAGIDIRSKTLTLKNARIAVYGDVGVSVGSENANATLTGLHIGGSCKTGFLLGGNGSTLDGCTVKPASGGTVDTAVRVSGSDCMVTNCSFEGVGVGILDESKTGAAVDNNLLTDCETGIRIRTANAIVLRNTLKGGKSGIAAEDDGGEISACMGKVYNLLVAKNRVENAENAILLSGVSNCTVFLNRTDDLTVRDCVNAYVVRNTVGGKLTLERNNYLLADSNDRAALTDTENENVNGGDLTDLSARAAVGVNEALLPHINREQFAGMTGRAAFRSRYGTLSLSAYLTAAVSAGETDIIAPPGAFLDNAVAFNGLSDVRFYGWGTYYDTVKSTATAFSFTACTEIGFSGFFIGNSVNPNFQGTVTKVTGPAGKETISFVSDPGYLANYSSKADYPATNGGGGGIYRGDSLSPYSEIWYEASSKTYDPTAQVNSLTLIWDGIKYGRIPGGTGLSSPYAAGEIKVGDRVAFRNYKGASGISMRGCSGFRIEDVTVFNCSGFALSEYDAEVAARLHRYSVTSGPAPVIDRIVNTKELATVNDANRYVTWTDGYGRLRSAFSLNTTCDATHSTNARVGMQAVSCLLENMMDDGGNINAHYGTAVNFDAATRTLTYKCCSTGGYYLLPAPFRVGDTVLLYTNKGVNVGSATVTEATGQTVSAAAKKDCRYTVKLSETVTLPADTDSVIVQNASASGNGFLWDNVLVRNNNSYGVRIQAIGGEIRNCSFIRLAKGGVNMIPQYGAWPECGYAADVKVTANVFEELGLMAAQWYDWDSVEKGSSFLPLCIWATGGDTSDADNCMFRNISITGNRFASRYTYYDMRINGVRNLTVSGNTFTGRFGKENGDSQAHILLCGGNGVRIDGNRFQSGANPVLYRRDDIAENVTGSDSN